MLTTTLTWDQAFPPACRHGAVTIGNFDGVHRGHIALVEELRRQAQRVGGPAVVVTFDPPPLQLLRPSEFQPMLTTVPDRSALLHEHGADHVLFLRTTWDLLKLTPEQFFEGVVQGGLAARALVEGFNFRFGHQREGTVARLQALCQAAGIGLAVVPPLEHNGTIVSSSRVRNALLQGDVRAAADLLSRPYRLRGTVGTGQQRGQKLGFPTANLEGVETVVPADGVYAVRARQIGNIWPGAANVGANPTFGEKARKIEVHLIGFQGDLVGQKLALDFVERLRDTRKFAGANQLVEQLRIDVEQARRLAEGVS
jgi:riboflavin kinase/FMN adenylyltransferase